MHSFELAQAIDRLERESENLDAARLSGAGQGRLAILGMRVRSAERYLEEIRQMEDARNDP